MRALAFATSGGARQGLGHVYRVASLARAAQSLGIPISVHIAGDEPVCAVAARELPGTNLVPWDGVSGIAPEACEWIVDTPMPIDPFLASARGAAVPVMVIDRTDQIDAADWTVLPVLHAMPHASPRVRQGADWCVLEPWNLGMQAPPYPGDRDILLVLFGGADAGDHTLRVAEALAQGPDLGIRPVFVVGPSAPPERTTELARYGEVLHAPRRQELFRWMGRARLAVCAFGVSLYELAALGTPALFVSRGRKDAAAALRLAAHGIGRFLGEAVELESDALADALDHALHGSWPSHAHSAGLRALGDGGGPGRILELALSAATR